MAFTPIYIDGFEHGLATVGTNGNPDYSTITGTGISIQTARVRYGTKALNLLTTAAAAQALKGRVGGYGTNPSIVRVGLHIWASSGGGDGRHLLRVSDSTDGYQLLLDWNNAGNYTLIFWNTVTNTTIATSATVTADAWHWVEIGWNLSATTHTYDWSVDGVTQTTPTSQTGLTARTAGLICFGHESNSAIRDDSFDNVVYGSAGAVTDTIGEQQVLEVQPSAVGTHNLDASTSQFFFKEVSAVDTALTTSETTSWQTLDDDPISLDADGIFVQPTTSFNTISRPSTPTSAATTSVSIPAHVTGDLILMFAYRSASSTAPTIPAGWTVLNTTTQTGSTKGWWGLYYKIAASSGEVSGTWTSATSLSCTVYRNAATPVAADATLTSGVSTSESYGARTIADTSHDWLVAFGASATGSTTTPSGLVVPTGYTEVATRTIFDSNAVRATNWPATGVTITSGAWGTATLDLKPSTLTTQPSALQYAEFDFPGISTSRSYWAGGLWTGLSTYGVGDGSFVLARGTQFTAPFSGSVTALAAHVAKVGAPTDNLLFEIYSDSSGSPGTLLATGTIAGTSLTTTDTLTTVSLGTPLSIVAGTRYWIIFTRSTAANGTNYYVVGSSSDTGTSVTSTNGTTWTVVAGASNAATMRLDATVTAPATAPLAVRAMVAKNLDTATATTWVAKLYDSDQGTAYFDDVANTSLSATGKTYTSKVFATRPAFNQMDVAAGSAVGFGTTTTNYMAESFTGFAGVATSVTLDVLRGSTLSGNITIELRSDNAGVPSNTVLATCTVAASTLPTSSSDTGVTFTFASPSTTLSSGTKYWIVAYLSVPTATPIAQWEQRANAFVGLVSATSNNGTSWSTGSSSLRYKVNGASAWTLAAFNALRLRFGYTAAATGHARLEAALLEAAFAAAAASTAYTTTITVTQTQSYLRGAAITAARTSTQTQSYTDQSAIAAARTSTQPQTFTPVKATTRPSQAFTQAATATLAAVRTKLLALLFTQTQTATTRRTVAAARSWSQTQASSFARALSTAKTTTQTQAATIARAAATIKTASQSAASTLRRSTTATRSSSQAQTTTSSRAAAATRSWSQTQTGTVAKAIATARAWTQATVAAAARAAATTRSWSQAQATTTRRTVGAARSWSQTQATSLSRAVSTAKTTTQSQAATIVRAAGATRTWTQAQTATGWKRAVGAARAFGQSTTATLSAVKSAGAHAYSQAITVTQAQVVQLTRAVGAGRSFTATQTSSIVKAASSSKAWTQTQAATARRGVAAAKTWTQTQAATAARAAATIKTASQSATSTLRRSSTATRSSSQAQTTTSSRAAAATRSWTQPQTGSFRKAVATLKAWTQTQAALLTSIAGARARFVAITVTQATSVTLARATSASRTATQTASSTLRRATTAARASVQPQSFTSRRAAATSRSWSQPQAGTLTKAASKAKAWTQAQTATVTRGPLGRFIAITVTQTTAATLARATRATRTASQATAATTARAVTATRAGAQATAASSSRAIATARLVAQTQTTTLLTRTARLLTLAFAQAQTHTSRRDVASSQTVVQPQTFTVSKAAGKLLAAVQAQTASWIHGFAASVAKLILSDRALLSVILGDELLTRLNLADAAALTIDAVDTAEIAVRLSDRPTHGPRLTDR